MALRLLPLLLAAHAETCTDRTIIRRATATLYDAAPVAVSLDLLVDEEVLGATLRADVRGDFHEDRAAATIAAGTGNVSCGGGGVSQCATRDAARVPKASGLDAHSEGTPAERNPGTLGGTPATRPWTCRRPSRTAS